MDSFSRGRAIRQDEESRRLEDNRRMALIREQNESRALALSDYVKNTLGTEYSVRWRNPFWFSGSRPDGKTTFMLFGPGDEQPPDTLSSSDEYAYFPSGHFVFSSDGDFIIFQKFDRLNHTEPTRFRWVGELKDNDSLNFALGEIFEGYKIRWDGSRHLREEKEKRRRDAELERFQEQHKIRRWRIEQKRNEFFNDIFVLVFWWAIVPAIIYFIFFL